MWGEERKVTVEKLHEEDQRAQREGAIGGDSFPTWICVGASFECLRVHAFSEIRIMTCSWAKASLSQRWNTARALQSVILIIFLICFRIIVTFNLRPSVHIHL